MKPKRHRPQRFGLNFEWVKIKILTPLFYILSAFAFVTICYFGYKNYKAEQAQIAEAKRIEQEIQASIAAEKAAKEQIRIETIIAEQNAKRLKRLEEQKRFSEERQRLGKEAKDIWKPGSYVHRFSDDSYSIIDHIEYPLVYTKDDWFYTIDEHMDTPEVEFASLEEWKHYYEHQIAKAKQKKKEDMEKILQQEKDKYTKIAKEKFPPSPVYGYCYYKDIGYRIVKWNGLDVVIEPVISETR